MTSVRTRFAPSPTGFLHVGGIRTALFAFLVAKQAKGTFVLRFEDTDKKREVPGSAEHLISSLKAIGIEYDEGPDVGGPFGPYIQSQRLDHYQAWAERLIEQGRAYTDPYTSEEMQSFRDEAAAQKRAFRYRDYRPEHPPVWDGTQPLRFRSDPKSYTYHDEVMGDITTSPEVVDDFILIKSDGYPTYNFAHIVDDAEMHISHVIRGQEFISSMPNYLALYEALGLERPIFAHLPHIMNEQGNKKLGKRDGAKDVLDYIRDGYLPEAMMSFIATMGWNDGTEQEIFTKQELINSFSLNRVQKSGARFDEKRRIEAEPACRAARDQSRRNIPHSRRTQQTGLRFVTKDSPEVPANQSRLAAARFRQDVSRQRTRTIRTGRCGRIVDLRRIVRSDPEYAVQPAASGAGFDNVRKSGAAGNDSIFRHTNRRRCPADRNIVR